MGFSLWDLNFVANFFDSIRPIISTLKFTTQTSIIPRNNNVRTFRQPTVRKLFSLLISTDFAPIDGLTFLLTIFFDNLWRGVALQPRHVPTFRFDDVPASFTRFFATFGPAGLSASGTPFLRPVKWRTPLSWNLWKKFFFSVSNVCYTKNEQLFIFSMKDICKC